MLSTSMWRPWSCCRYGALGAAQDVVAVVDTGYNGWLTLPYAVIAALGLAWDRRGWALLADGSESIFDIYGGSVRWDGQRYPVAVDAAEYHCPPGGPLVRCTW